MIGILTVSFVVVFVMLFLNGVFDLVAGDATIVTNETSMYNVTSQINEDLAIFNETTTNANADSSWGDIIGNFLSQVFGTFKLTTHSFSAFATISEEAIDQTNLGSSAAPLKAYIWGILMILIFVGLFMAILSKHDV